MATGEKKGFIARMLEGKERDDAYARSTLPSNRCFGIYSRAGFPNSSF